MSLHNLPLGQSLVIAKGETVRATGRLDAVVYYEGDKWFVEIEGQKFDFTNLFKPLFKDAFKQEYDEDGATFSIELEGDVWVDDEKTPPWARQEFETTVDTIDLDLHTKRHDSYLSLNKLFEENKKLMHKAQEVLESHV